MCKYCDFDGEGWTGEYISNEKIGNILNEEIFFKTSLYREDECMHAGCIWLGKECEECEDTEPKYFFIAELDGISLDRMGSIATGECEIKYCPMCGRKLVED